MPDPLSLRDEAIQAAEATVDGTQVDAVAIPPMVDAVLGVLTTRLQQLPGVGRGDHGESLPSGELLPRRDVLAALGVAPTTPEPPKDNYEPPGETPENFIGGAPITEDASSEPPDDDAPADTTLGRAAYARYLASLPTHDQEQPAPGSERGA